MRCETIADEGTEQAVQCVRESHPEDPDAHDFVGAPSAPVDGGRPWHEWIQMVHDVRSLLMTDRAEGDVEHEGRVGEWDLDRCRATIADVASTVGLYVRHVQGDPVVIGERPPS